MRNKLVFKECYAFVNFMGILSEEESYVAPTYCKLDVNHLKRCKNTSKYYMSYDKNNEFVKNLHEKSPYCKFEIRKALVPNDAVISECDYTEEYNVFETDAIKVLDEVVYTIEPTCTWDECFSNCLEKLHKLYS